MKTFVKLDPNFWIDYRNTELISSGADVQLLSLYLVGNTHHNMLGAYYLPVAYIANDIRMSPRRVKTALQRLCEIGYCRYDERTQYVWVCNMMSEQIGEGIDAKDNRVKYLQAIWKSLPPSLSFLEEIYRKYYKTFHLEPREFEKSAGKVASSKSLPSQALSKLQQTTSKPLPRPEEGNAKVTQPPSEPLQRVPDDLSCPLVMQDDTTDQKNPESAAPLKELASPFEAPCTTLSSPSEGSSEPLRRSFEAPSEPLRSIIDYRYKNIEYRTKKLEVEKKRDNIQSTVVHQNIVAQARPPAEDLSPPDSFFLKAESVPETTLANNPTSVTINQDQIALVFEHWKHTMQHEKSTLDSKRRALIRKALQGYSVEQLCQAISGCSYTPHNIGQNDRGQRYDGLHVILRDADQIDRFIYNYHNPPRFLTQGQQRLQNNLQAANVWLQKTGS